jgi:hypothetical protein
VVVVSEWLTTPISKLDKMLYFDDEVGVLYQLLADR